MWIDDFYFTLPSALISLEFTSYLFVAFTLLVFVITRAWKANVKAFLLLLANLFFIYSYGFYHAFFVIFLGLFTYLLSLLVDRIKNKFSYIAVLTIFFLLLAYFKYFNVGGLIMPLGLSFYSFKAMSYLFDIIQQKIEKENNILYVLCYLSFFPSMIAGPIHRSKTFFHELENPKEFNYQNARSGGFQLLLGIFEKVVFCDFVASVVSRIEGNTELLGWNIAMMIFLYAIQIYLDFDSLSNIAIGSARLLGFELTNNFKAPYLASTLKEFWHRWHISLSTWFRDYIYIFLGGSRKGKFVQYLNIIVVFLISGLWHGNSLNFLLWGLAHGFIQVMEDIILKPFQKKQFRPVLLYLFKVFGILVNFAIVSILWLVFKYQTWAEVMLVLEKLVTYQTLDWQAIGLTTNEVYWLFSIVLIVVGLDFIRYKHSAINLFYKLYFPFRWIIYTLLIAVFLIFGVYGGSFNANDFIYRWF